MDKKLKRVFSSLKTKSGAVDSRSNSNGAALDVDFVGVHDDTPEGNISRAIQKFCETGGPENSNPGDEFLHLPVIVDNAESSPSAAALATTILRRNLADSKNNSRTFVLYNSIMLLRILSQNPGETFTRGTSEPKFVAAVKGVLRSTRDPTVMQLLYETLEHFSTDEARMRDPGLNALREMWVAEKEKDRKKLAKKPPTSSFLPMVPSPSNLNPNHTPATTGAPSSHSTALPSVIDFTSRIAEANTSATLLQQLLQSTPLSEVAENDLIKEFVDRCKLAQKSVQGYIHADPPADEDTLTTLIETHDLLRLALERHRAMVKEIVEKREEPVSGEARVGVVGEGVPAGREVMHGAGTVGEATYGAEDMEASPVSPLSSEHSPPQVAYRF